MITRQISSRLLNVANRRIFLPTLYNQRRDSSIVTTVVDTSPLAWICQDAKFTVFFEQAFLHSADYVHWVPSVILGGVALRTLFSPLVALALKDTIKYLYVMSTMAPVLENIEKVIRQQGAAKKQTKKEIEDRIYSEKSSYRAESLRLNNCHPLKTKFLGFLQLPVWLSMTYALKNIADAGRATIAITDTEFRLLVHTQALNDFVNTNFLWIPSLAYPDPYFILPVLVTSTYLLTLMVRRMETSIAPSRTEPLVMKILSGIMALFAAIAGIACSQLPSAVGLFWWTVGIGMFILTLLMKSTRAQRLLKLPHVPGLFYDKPFRSFLKNIVALLNRK